MTLAAFIRREDGAVAVVAGAAIAAAVGLAAFTVDLSNAYSVKGRLQNAADAAALAAAQRLPET
ncbi:MAG TPA: pilus assembly protein TadG-related protein [Afifellaceae bacterium]|nr:pilus assembly protein TadG-related protein [Afifellaceae bacterium]